MDRFNEALGEVHARYTYMERPRGSPSQQVGDCSVAAQCQTTLRCMLVVNRSKGRLGRIEDPPAASQLPGLPSTLLPWCARCPLCTTCAG